ncbi:MAG: carboxypeptidase regulatory-like domain-containing protein [Acidobacteria bacterium]|nr:carboxypeptidase regulatory-like domain-containing protein [Acidobacteriota bacterium]
MRNGRIRTGIIGIVGALVLALSMNAFAQEFRATITGSVKDPNGANVVGATVVVKNIATNIANTVTTNEDGSYTVPFLVPGKYSINVSGNGFKTSVRESVELNVDDRLTIDFQLEIGTQAEVNIVAGADLVERGSVTTGTVISNRQVEELPLPEGAVLTLVTQAPGVVYTGNPQFTGPTANGNLASFRTNGAGGNQINLDGSPNLAFAGQVAFTPPSDAVQEFKVQTNSFDAQNGFTAGSTVNVALKSGTNKFHGSVYYYDRDKSRTANNFFNNRLGLEQAPRKYFRYGGSVNGPIFKDRTFFLFTYEKQKDNISEPTTFRVPTALQRTGDFSELLPSTVIYDPATAFLGNTTCGTTGTLGTVCRTPFAGNIIAPGRINSVSQRYLNLFPLPNQPIVNGIGVYASNMNLLRPYESYLGKVDHNFNESHKIFGKYYYSKSSEDRYNWLGQPDSPTRGFEYRVNKGANVNYTATLSSSLILDVRGSYNLFSQERRPANPIAPADLGFSSAALSAFRGSTVIPRFDFASFTTASIANAIGSNRSDYNEGLYRPFNLMSIQPTVTQIFGDHTFRYGYDLRILKEKNETNGFRSGRFQFDGTYTAQASNSSTALRAAYGRDLAAFLLGIPTASTNSFADNPTVYDVKSTYHGVFFQDDWRVNQKLTINWGLRYEYETGVTEAEGRIVTGFDKISANPLRASALANYNASVPTGVPVDAFQSLAGGLLFATSASDANQSVDKNNWQPRVGVSYSLDDKTVIRAGFGIFVAPFQITAVNQAGFSTPTLFVPSTNNGLTFIADLNNPFPSGVAESPGSSLGLATFIGRDLTVLANERKNAQFWRFIAGFQREMKFGIGLDVNFIHSRGYDLAVNRSINNIPTAYLNAGTEFSSTVSTFLGASVPNPFRGLVPSNATFNAATIARRNLLTPYPEFGNVVLGEYNGTSNYTAIQIQAVKRFTKGLSLNASYSFSREHESTAYLNPQDENLTDQVSPTERPHRITFSGIYELPIGRGRWIGKDWNRWVDALIGGWQFQSNYEWQSGEPLVFGNVYYDPQAVNPYLLKSRLGKKNEAGLRYGIDIPAFDVTGFYPAGFILNGASAPASIGLGTTNIGSNNTLRYFPLTTGKLRNQRFLNFNLGMSKNFRIREGMKIQLRVEAINVLNTPYFSAPNLSPSNTPNLTTAGASNLGRFGFTNGPTRQPPRDIQIGARFTF